MTPESSIQRFRRVVSAAYAQLETRREEVNDLNVFPVADGDTGDNMALTMRAVMEELDRLEDRAPEDPATREDLVHAVARAALMGARGNSGVILSQIVRGFAEILASRPGELIDPVLVEVALSEATRVAYESVRNPAEGTMLTVVRAMSHAVTQKLGESEHARLDHSVTAEEQNRILADVLQVAVDAGMEAVRRTPEQLDALAEAGVVDAGAFGLVIILAGALAALRGEDEPIEIERQEPARMTRPHHADSKYRYCTNFIVTGHGLDSRAFVPALERVGDSVLVVGDDETLRVHVHADDIDAAVAIFAGAGEVGQLESFDMREQIAERDARLAGAATAVVAVAAGAGMRDLFEGLGALVVDGGATLNPSTSEIYAAVEAARGEGVLVLPNSKNVLMAAREAANLTDGRARVIESLSQQAGLAALVEFDPDAPVEQNAARLTESLAHVRAGSVAPAARDDAEGRFVRGDAVGFVGDELFAWGGAGTTLTAVAERLAAEAEILTVIEGAGAPIPLDDLPLHLRGDVELELHVGGQPAYWWLLAAQ